MSLDITFKSWVYGCTHIAWPQNKIHDFVPIVNCQGDPTKCEIPIMQKLLAKIGRKKN